MPLRQGEACARRCSAASVCSVSNVRCGIHSTIGQVVTNLNQLLLESSLMNAAVSAVLVTKWPFSIVLLRLAEAPPRSLGSKPA